MRKLSDRLLFVHTKLVGERHSGWSRVVSFRLLRPEVDFRWALGGTYENYLGRDV